MRRPSNTVMVLLGVHTVCLAVGFWFLCQLMASSNEHQGIEASWNRLDARTSEIVELARSLGTNAVEADTQVESRLVSFAQGLSANNLEVILVNGGGGLTSVISASPHISWTAGAPVAWQPIRRQPHGKEVGWLTTPQGLRAALREASPEGNAALIVYEPAPPTPAWQELLHSSLFQAALIAFVWTWLLLSVATYLLTARINSDERTRNAQREHDALRSAQDLLRTRDAVIFGLAKLAESRDPETGQHLERISLYSTRLATALRSVPRYHGQVTPGFIRLLGISSVLHDIGKVGLEDTVLLKPGRLTLDERLKMQQHTIVAGDCLREIEQRLGASNFLQTAREIAVHHHERWDGNGYPVGLKGEDIPLAARIVSIADVYDALSSKRVYKEAFSHEECVRLIREGAGSQFDPELVEIFLSIESDFAAIAVRFGNQRDSQSPPGTPAVMSTAQESLLLEIVADPTSRPPVRDLSTPQGSAQPPARI